MTEEVKKTEDTPQAEESKEETTTEETVEVPEKFKALVEGVEQMSVLDLAELVKILEKKFGVSASAPAMMMAGPAGGDAGEAVEEKTSFDIEITEAGSTKIAVIKAIRATSELGLKEAKELVDAAPKVFRESVDKAEAEKIKADLEAAGAKVTLK